MLGDALNYAISMDLIFKDEIDSTTFDNLMDEDSNIVFELSCLTFNIKKNVVGVLEFLISFFKNMGKTNFII